MLLHRLRNHRKRVINVFLVILIQPILRGRYRIFGIIHHENNITGTTLRSGHCRRREYIGQPAVDRGGVIAANTAQIADHDLRYPVCPAPEIKVFMSGNIRGHVIIGQQLPKLALEAGLIKQVKLRHLAVCSGVGGINRTVPHDEEMTCPLGVLQFRL